MNKKAALEMPFTWLFALIIGAVILFLAIFIAMQFIESFEKGGGTETAAETINILEKVESSIDSAAINSINFKSRVRIYNECSDIGNFGEQKIKIAKQGIGDKWAEPSGSIGIKNKYLFSDKFEQGNQFYIFSKPFNFPFKVGDLIIISSKKYCFKDAPDFIKDEISSINIQYKDFLQTENCSEDSIKVCSSGICDIKINENLNTINKNNQEIYYLNNLVYAGIFSDSEIYECQVKRLYKRIEKLARLYKDKSQLSSIRGCESALDNELISLINTVKDLEDSSGLFELEIIVEDIQNKNQELICELF